MSISLYDGVDVVIEGLFKCLSITLAIQSFHPVRQRLVPKPSMASKQLVMALHPAGNGIGTLEVVYSLLLLDGRHFHLIRGCKDVCIGTQALERSIILLSSSQCLTVDGYTVKKVGTFAQLTNEMLLALLLVKSRTVSTYLLVLFGHLCRGDGEHGHDEE